VAAVLAIAVVGSALGGVGPLAGLFGGGGILGETGAPEVTARRTVTPNVNHLVPNVYRMIEADALEVIAEAGFTHVVVNRVCSDSVPTAGLVRRVVVDNGAAAGKETILVDKPGSLLAVPLSTKLKVKVANGKPC